MRRYFTRRCLALHLTLLVLLPVFIWLTRWQLGRALDGNSLSWAYTFEWPLFAGYAIYMWWQLIHDSARRTPQTAKGGPTFGARSGADRLEPGWALNGGRERNVAIAAATAIGPGPADRSDRYREQTPEEAEELAAYNRYLSELAAADDAEARRP